MESTVEKITDTVSDAFKSIAEIAKERIFTPMYFYFLGAWVITNWKFVYTFFFADEALVLQHTGMLKVEYLTQIYPHDWTAVFPLFVIPFGLAYLAVWWFSIVSEKFYKKHEEHQMNKRVIKREVAYREKVAYFKSEREVREQQLDHQVKYEDNRDYNEQIDESNPEVEVNGVPMLPSEVLYKTDYLAYKAGLDEYNNEMVQKGEDLAVQAETDRRRGK